jgi:hypothetical protein
VLPWFFVSVISVPRWVSAQFKGRGPTARLNPRLAHLVSVHFPASLGFRSSRLSFTNGEATPNLSLNPDPTCTASRSLSSSRFLGFARRFGAGGAG